MFCIILCPYRLHFSSEYDVSEYYRSEGKNKLANLELKWSAWISGELCWNSVHSAVTCRNIRSPRLSRGSTYDSHMEQEAEPSTAVPSLGWDVSQQHQPSIWPAKSPQMCWQGWRHRWMLHLWGSPSRPRAVILNNLHRVTHSLTSWKSLSAPLS